MTIYNVGILIKSDNTENSNTFELIFVSHHISTDNLHNFNLKLPEEDYRYLYQKLDNWKYFNSKTEDEKLVEILEKTNLCQREISTEAEVIIYEIVEDIDGNFYGKELITGLLFPLRTINNKKIEYSYNYDNKNLLKRKLTYTNENLSRFMYIITNGTVASTNEVNKYLKIKKNKIKLKRHTARITKIYNENVFNKTIILKDKTQREEQNEVTKIMEDIELSLNILNLYSTSLYEKYMERYKLLCDDDNNSINQYKTNIEDYKRLLSSIKLYIIIKKDLC